MALVNLLLVCSDKERELLSADCRVLESFHCGAAFAVLREEASNVLSALALSVQQDVRQRIISLVLATNINGQSAFLSRFSESIIHCCTGGDTGSPMLQPHKPDSSLGTGEELPGSVTSDKPSTFRSRLYFTVRSPKRTSTDHALTPRHSSAELLDLTVSMCLMDANTNVTLQTESQVDIFLQMIIKVSDVASVARPKALYRRWADAFTDELFQQGDQERANGLPVTQFFDRYSPAERATFHAYHTRTLAKPLIDALGCLSAPIRRVCCNNAKSNLELWEGTEPINATAIDALDAPEAVHSV